MPIGLMELEKMAFVVSVPIPIPVPVLKFHCRGLQIAAYRAPFLDSNWIIVTANQ